MNKLVTCPYDEVHKVKESRLSMHIAKCRLNHLDEEKSVCPFNATHVIPKQELNYHLNICLDRAPVDRKLMANSMDKNNPFRGNTSVPSYTESVPTVCDEVWDDEYYEPQVAKAPPSCAIIEPPALAKPAERRRLYQELHRMPTETERISELPSNLPSKEAANLIRQPKAPSQIESKKSVQEFQNVGIGRGKASQSRIAANIFPSSLSQDTKVHSLSSGNYSAALTSGMSNLGLGRGYSTNAAVDNGLDDEQFPALGCGRGVYKSSKNGTRYPGSRN